MPASKPRGVMLKKRLPVLSFAIALALPGLSLAQEKTDRDEVAQLDTITVTAQRRAENVQEVPISITTIDGEKLDVLGSGGEDIRFLSGRLPSLNIESSFGRTFPRFYIRGLGNGDFDLNASQPVSLIYDEIVQENPILKGFPVFDLDRVELLRGPQGTLFGRNTPAGVLKFDSARPTQEFEGYGQISYGSHGSTNIEGAVSGGLTDSVSARLSVLNQHRDDWVTNTGPGLNRELEGYDELAVRAQLLVEPSDSFSALFNAHMRSLDGTARLFRANIFTPGTNNLVPGFDPETVSIDGLNDQELDTHGFSGRLTWDLGRTTFHSVTGFESGEVYSRGDIDGGFGASFFPPFGPGFIPFDAESADGIPSLDQFTQEFRLESNEWGKFDWQAGVFYFDEDLFVDSFNYSSTFGGGAQNGYATQRQQNKAWAIFAAGEYDVTDELTLRAGVRFTDDKKRYVAQRFDSPIDFLGASETLGPLYANPSDSDVSWDFSATYAINDDINVYGRIARGFRAPSIQGRLLFGDIVSVASAETAMSYEAGIKATVLDNRARLGFSVFHYTIDDQQITAVGGATNFNTLINAAETIGQGFELDAEAFLTDNLLVTMGLSYNDTEINDPNLMVAVCGGGCTVTDPTVVVGGATLAMIDGNPLPQAPEWVSNMTARYSVPMGDGAEFFIFTDWAYRSEVNFFLYEAAEFRGKSLLEGGLRVGYNWDYGKYEVALFGRNILDKVVAVGGIDFNNLTGFINEPRVVGVEFTARF